MARRPNPIPPGPDTHLRISFQIDFRERKNSPLHYLATLDGHGDRPRELLRLALLGKKTETEMMAITEMTHNQVLQRMKNTIERENVADQDQQREQEQELVSRHARIPQLPPQPAHQPQSSPLRGAEQPTRTQEDAPSSPTSAQAYSPPRATAPSASTKAAQTSKNQSEKGSTKEKRSRPAAVPMLA